LVFPSPETSPSFPPPLPCLQKECCPRKTPPRKTLSQALCLFFPHPAPPRRPLRPQTGLRFSWSLKVFEGLIGVFYQLSLRPRLFSFLSPLSSLPQLSNPRPRCDAVFEGPCFRPEQPPNSRRVGTPPHEQGPSFAAQLSLPLCRKCSIEGATKVNRRSGGGGGTNLTAPLPTSYVL